MKELIRNIAIGWLVGVTFSSIIGALLLFGFETVALAIVSLMILIPILLFTGLAIAVLIMPDYPS